MAGETLVEQHIPLALRLAQRMSKERGITSPHEKEEIISDALLGLVQAQKKWRNGGGTTFGGYARRRIRWAMRDGLRGRTRKISTVSLDVILRIEQEED
jgi:RNA polymerase sigma factor (sigma-70 family)